MLTLEILNELVPDLQKSEEWLIAIEKTCQNYVINDEKRLAAFLAQIMFESEYFTEIVENMNYSAGSLLRVFPKYFASMAEAYRYARQPEKIGNHVYANRMGNGDEASGDGSKFRGRGAIAITGRDAYQRLANDLNMSLDEVVSYLETTEGAVESAGWFWNTHDLNDLADLDEFTKITQRINGGLNGLSERKAIWSRVQSLLKPTSQYTS